MIKLSTFIFSLFIFINSCVSPKVKVKIIFDEIFNQSSSLTADRTYLIVIDSVPLPNVIEEDIVNHIYNLKNDTMIEQRFSTIHRASLKSEVLALNTGQYQFISDTTSDIWKEMKHRVPDMYQLRTESSFTILLAKNAIGDCELHIYDDRKKALSKLELGNYSGYVPQSILHDFNNDGINEIIILSNYYLQNHYLVNVKIYKLQNNR